MEREAVVEQARFLQSLYDNETARFEAGMRKMVRMLKEEEAAHLAKVTPPSSQSAFLPHPGLFSPPSLPLPSPFLPPSLPPFPPPSSQEAKARTEMQEVIREYTEALKAKDGLLEAWGTKEEEWAAAREGWREERAEGEAALLKALEVVARLEGEVARREQENAAWVRKAEEVREGGKEGGGKEGGEWWCCEGRGRWRGGRGLHQDPSFLPSSFPSSLPFSFPSSLLPPLSRNKSASKSSRAPSPPWRQPREPPGRRRLASWPSLRRSTPAPPRVGRPGWLPRASRRG
jgi:hypothetical protein